MNMLLPSAKVLRRAYKESEQAMRDLRAEEAKKQPQKPTSRVEVGSAVVVGLRGGGRVAGILARRISNGVVIESDDGADVVVLENASYGTRVLSRG